MSTSKKKNLILPHYVLQIVRFLLAYQAMRVFDRLKIVGGTLLRWTAFFYVPLGVWMLGGVTKYFLNWNGGPFETALPFFVGWLPLPFFYPSSGNVLAWALCILLGVLWAMASSVVLNVIVERAINCERIEEKWRRACLHVGLVTSTNLEPENDVKEFPPVVSVTPKAFVIQSKGFTPEIIQEKRTELSAAMGVFIGDVSFLKKPDGSTHADLLEVSYAWNDLPAMVPLRNVPVAGAGEIVLGKSWQGWEKISLEQMLHMAVAGESGSGKSVFLRSMIVQLLATERNAVIVGIDFKGGAEFSFFEQLGNFICVDEHESAAHALRVVFDEYKRRVGLVRASQCDSVYQLGESVAPIIIFVDEAAEFFQSGKVSGTQSESIALVEKLARLGRFAAIHLIISTQRPDASVIPPQIRSMLTTRAVFKQSQKEDSIMILGNAAATKLRKIAGRFYLRGPDGNLKELQAPYIGKSDAKEILMKQPAAESSELVQSMRKVAWKMRLAA